MIINAKVIGQVDPAEYHQQSAERGDRKFTMSRGELFLFAKNPKKWILGAREKDTKSTEWGSLMDCLVLEPDKFSKRFVTHPRTYRPKKPKNAESKPWTRGADICAEWCEEKEKAGLTVLKPDDETEARNAAGFITDDFELCEILGHSKFQQMATADYVDKATGFTIALKILVDIVPPAERKELIDFKTGSCASPSVWRREIFRYGLHLQGAMYLDIWTAATGEDRVGFSHIVQENSAPYVFEKNSLDAEYIRLGRSAYRAALEKYCRCIKSGDWPGYPISSEFDVIDGWTFIGPEPWMLTASAEKNFPSDSPLTLKATAPNGNEHDPDDLMP